MSKRIDYSDLVGSFYESKLHGQYEVLEHIPKNAVDKQHRYYIKFVETKYEQYMSYTQHKNNTVKDERLLKEQKKSKEIVNLKYRNKRTKKSKVKYNLDGLCELKVFSIDLATKRTGLSFFKRGNYKGSHLIEAEGDCYLERSHKIVKTINDYIYRYDIEALVIEETYLGLNSNVKQKLDTVKGMLCYVAKMNECRIEFIAPKVWKSAVPGMPKNREEQKSYTMQKFAEETKIERKFTDDEADSYFLGKFAVRK